jgi:thioredoxin-related protein
MIVYHSFCNRIKKENKSNEVLKDYQNEEYDKLMFEYGLQNGTINTSEHSDEEDC